MKIRWPVFALLLCALASPVSARVLLVFGDSLSTAFGMDETQGWVHLLGERLKNKCPATRILNESVNGETTKGGLKRLPEVLEQHSPQVVILELGANDGLRFARIKRIRENLKAMIRMIRQHGAQVVLAGVRLPDYYPERYHAAFFENYAHIAKEHGLVHIPNLLEGVSKIEDGFLFDGLHPSAAAQLHILENVWPHLSALLQCTMARAHEHPCTATETASTFLSAPARHRCAPVCVPVQTPGPAGAAGRTPLHWTTYHPGNPAMAEELMRATGP